MKLKGKTAVVTGGTGGLGWRVCKALAEENMKIALVYRNSRETAERYAAELEREGGEAFAVQADVTTEAGIAKMTEETLKKFGALDALILDAAYNTWITFQNLEALDKETWNHILNYNLTAPYLAMRLIGPEMKRRGGGRIVTVSSIAGLQPGGSSIAYCVSKAGLIHLTRCMAVALAPEVLVNCVAPGMMEGTRMTENLAPDYARAARETAILKRAADKDDVADVIRTFVKTDSITGQTLVVDGGKFFH